MSYLRPNSSRPNNRANSTHSHRPNTAHNTTGMSGFKDTTINPQRREKLKNLLFEKYKKKFGRLFPDNDVKVELNNFMDKELLSEKDLKELDKKIEKIVFDNQNKTYLFQNLNPSTTTNKNTNGNVYGISNINNVLNNEPAKFHKSAKKSSTLSQYSRSKQGDIGYQDYNEENKSNNGGGFNGNGNKKNSGSASNYGNNRNNDDDDKISVFSHQKPVQRLEFDEKGEWNAIAEFNKQDYINQLQKERQKDKELKEKTRKQLNEQMMQSKMRKQNEKTGELIYGEYIGKTVAKLTQREIEEQNIVKEKNRREKQIRDEQMIENKLRQKKDFKAQREFEICLLNRVHKEAEEEKNKELNKVKKRHNELIETLKENEVNKKISMERQERERQEDINAQIEYGKMLDKQEKERADYFKDRERKGNTFISLMVENVIKEQDMKNKKLDDALKKHQDQKDQL